MPAVRVGEIADFLGARYEGDRGLMITGVRPLSTATAEHLSFLSNPRYAAQLEESRAGAVLVSEDHPGDDRRYVRVAKPYYELSRVLTRWFSEVPHPDEGVAESAFIHPTATLGSRVRVGHFVSVAEGASIGDGAILHDGVRIGAGSKVGAASILYANVVVYHGVTIGARCIVHGGCVLGADGFGFATEQGIHHKIPQIGGVRIGDDVEIGANTTIDRGALEDTVIGDGTKIDDQVMIGHGAQFGRGCILVAETAISGSTRAGDYVVFGGRSGAAGHLTIASGVQIAANGVAMKSLRKAGIYAGIPARPLSEHQRTEAGVRRIGKLRRRVAALERTVGVTSAAEESRGNHSDD